MIVSFQSFGQSDKCLTLSNNIITNIKGKVLSQNSEYIKCEFLPKYTDPIMIKALEFIN